MKASYIKQVAALGLASALAAPAAMAAPILTWDWALFAGWTDSTVEGGGDAGTSGGPYAINPVDGSPMGHHTLEWGSGSSGPSQLVIDTPFLSSQPGAFGVATPRPQLVLVDQGDGTYEAAPVPGTEFTHVNNVISADDNSLTSAVLTEWFALTPGGGDLGATPIVDNPSFDIFFAETFNEENADDCPTDELGGDPCEDIFVISNPEALSYTFALGGYFYTIDVTAPNLNVLPDAACAEAGVANGCVGIITEEGNENASANFLVGFSARPVSAPSVLALMGLGLLGIGYGRRRSRK